MANTGKLMKVIMFEKLFRELHLDRASTNIGVNVSFTDNDFRVLICSSVLDYNGKNFIFSKRDLVMDVASTVRDGLRKFQEIYNRYKGKHTYDECGNLTNKECIDELNESLPEYIDNLWKTDKEKTLSHEGPCTGCRVAE